MIGLAMYITIQTLWERCRNKSEIARLTCHDWKTVAKAIRQIEEGKEYPKKKPHPRLLDPHKEQIAKWIEEKLTGVRMHEELRRLGVNVGYSTVKEYISRIRKRNNIFVRVHTLPGEEAQVDFGYVGLTPDGCGKRRKTWVFDMRLSYSRLDYYEKVYDQRVETFIQCHRNAFNYFKGVPEYVKTDNLKAAILKAHFYEPIYQRLYKNFAQHYGFRPHPCRVRKPNDKGKVESGIKYVKRNFFLGRTFKDSDDVDRQLRNWMDSTSNQRLHGTTRKIPREVFEHEEKNHLKGLPEEDSICSASGCAKYTMTAISLLIITTIQFPSKYIGKEVDIEVGKDLLRVYHQGKHVAVHTLLERKRPLLYE